jgi:hypothetical protein
MLQCPCVLPACVARPRAMVRMDRQPASASPGRSCTVAPLWGNEPVTNIARAMALAQPAGRGLRTVASQMRPSPDHTASAT